MACGYSKVGERHSCGASNDVLLFSNPAALFFFFLAAPPAW